MRCLGYGSESVHGESPWSPGPAQRAAVYVPIAKRAVVLPSEEDPAQRPETTEPAHL